MSEEKADSFPLEMISLPHPGVKARAWIRLLQYAGGNVKTATPYVFFAQTTVKPVVFALDFVEYWKIVV